MQSFWKNYRFQFFGLSGGATVSGAALIWSSWPEHIPNKSWLWFAMCVGFTVCAAWRAVRERDSQIQAVQQAQLSERVEFQALVKLQNQDLEDLREHSRIEAESRQRDWNRERDDLKKQLSDLGRPLVSLAIEDGTFVVHNHEAVAFSIQIKPIFIAAFKPLTFPVIHSLAAGAKTRVTVNEIGLGNTSKSDPTDEELLKVLLDDTPTNAESVSVWDFTIDYTARDGQEWRSHGELIYDRSARVVRLEHLGAGLKRPPTPQSAQFYPAC